MERLLVSIAVAIWLVLLGIGLGNVVIKSEQCPPVNAVHLVLTPFGVAAIEAKKGTYEESKHSLGKFLVFEGWITPEEFDVYLKGSKKVRKPEESKKREDTI